MGEIGDDAIKHTGKSGEDQLAHYEESKGIDQQDDYEQNHNISEEEAQSSPQLQLLFCFFLALWSAEKHLAEYFDVHYIYQGAQQVGQYQAYEEGRKGSADAADGAKNPCKHGTEVLDDKIQNIEQCHGEYNIK